MLATGSRPGDTIVLCYHGISDVWPAAVTPASLAAHLRLLLKRGYRPIGFSRAVLDPPSKNAFAVTFDDGYRSVFTTALPILARLGVCGTVFVPSGFVGAGVAAWSGTDCWVGTAHERELAPMTWDELRALRDAGWEIGSHSRTHPRLLSISDGELADELRSSRAEIEHHLGGSCLSIAYPYGESDLRVEEAARRAGFAAGCTLTASFEHASTLAWPRVGVYRHDGPLRFRAKVSRRVLRLRHSRWWTLLRLERLHVSSEYESP
jgi:peptidoglycan/xylan/chitin deacetylase (PgdA/CDA1 family)